MHAAEFPLLSLGEFGLLAAQFPLGAGDVHALAGAHADEIGFKPCEGGEDVKNIFPMGSFGSVERRARGAVSRRVPEAGRRWRGHPGQTWPGGRVWARPRCRPGARRPGPGRSRVGRGAGEAVIGVDTIFGDAELQEGLSLGGQVLAVGGAAGVTDAGCGHGGSVRIGSPCAIVTVPFM